MNRTKKFLYNSTASIIQQIVLMIVGFITPRVMLNIYGSELNGLVSSIMQFIAYFSLVEAGLGNAAIFSLYKPLAENNTNSINGILTAAKKFYNFSGYIFLVLVMLLSIVYPVFGDSVIGMKPFEISILVFVLGLSGVIEFFSMSKYRVLLTADQKSYIVSLSSILYISISTILLVTMAYLKFNIVVLKIFTNISVIFRSLILYFYVKNNYKYINYNVTPNTSALKNRWDALYLQILGVVQSGFPIIIITILINYMTVSVYTIYNMIIGAINGVLSIFLNNLSASFGNIIAKKEYSTLQKSYREFEFIYYSLITIIYSCTFILIMPFIKLYTYGITDTNYDLPIVGFLFVINGLLYNIKTPQGMLINSAGLYRETRIQTTIQALILIIFGIILTPKFGLAGTLVAMILSNIYRDLDLLIYIPQNVTLLKIQSTVYRWVNLFLELFLIVFTIRFINFEINNYIQWITYAFIVFLYACFVVLIGAILFERKELNNVFSRVKFLLKNR